MSSEKVRPICDFWDEGQATLPPHSRLYHLEPIGVGTSLVESLTSYIVRLAEAHSVHPRALVTDEIAPLLRQSHIYQQGCLVYNYLTSFWKNSHLLNGTGATAGDWVQALERLTLRYNLRLLTLLCWSEVLRPDEITQMHQSLVFSMLRRVENGESNCL